MANGSNFWRGMYAIFYENRIGNSSFAASWVIADGILNFNEMITVDDTRQQ